MLFISISIKLNILTNNNDYILNNQLKGFFIFIFLMVYFSIDLFTFKNIKRKKCQLGRPVKTNNR